MTTTAPQHRLARPWPLWFGLFGGVTAWLLHLAIGFALVHDACAIGWAGLDLWLWIITGALGFVALIATFVAYGTWRRANRQEDTASEIMRGRTYFMGFMGAWLSGLSLLMILTTAVAIFWLNPCL